MLSIDGVENDEQKVFFMQIMEAYVGNMPTCSGGGRKGLR